MLKGACKGQQGLARSGNALKRNKLHLGIGDGMQGKNLFGIAGGDPVRGLLLNALDPLQYRVVIYQGRSAVVLENEIMVGDGVLDAQVFRHAKTIGIYGIDNLPGQPFNDGPAGIQRIYILDLTGFKILGRDVKRFGLKPEVDVFGNQGDFLFGMVLTHG